MPYLQLKSWHLCFFTATNPGIDTGGLGLESKFATIEKIPAHLKPKTIFVPDGEVFQLTQQKLVDAEISYPIIAKPDIGYRGLLVKKIATPTELEQYLNQYPIDFILQEFIEVLNEFGVLYYRLPHEKQGRITSLTFKDFLHVVGDGQSSVRELIEAKPRARLQLDRLKKNEHKLLSQVPKTGHRVPLGIIGNHSKGTHFINANRHIDEQLTRTFDEITNQISGVFYGRYDIKCPSFEELKAGKNISIIEINGVCAEPTHIYDAEQTSYFKALKDIVNHWKIIYQISRANRQLGATCMPPAEMVGRFRELNRYLKTVSNGARQT